MHLEAAHHKGSWKPLLSNMPSLFPKLFSKWVGSNWEASSGLPHQGITAWSFSLEDQAWYHPILWKRMVGLSYFGAWLRRIRGPTHNGAFQDSLRPFWQHPTNSKTKKLHKKCKFDQFISISKTPRRYNYNSQRWICLREIHIKSLSKHQTHDPKYWILKKPPPIQTPKITQKERYPISLYQFQDTQKINFTMVIRL